MDWKKLFNPLFIMIIFTATISAEEKKEFIYSEKTHIGHDTDLVPLHNKDNHQQIVFEAMQLNRTESGNIIVTGTTKFHAAYHLGIANNGGLNLVYNSIKYCIGDSGSVGCYNTSGTSPYMLPTIQENLNSNFNTDYTLTTISNSTSLVNVDGERLYDVIAAGYNWSTQIHSQSEVSEYLEAGGNIILSGSSSHSGEIPFLPYSVTTQGNGYGYFPGPASDPDHPLAQNVEYGEWGYNSEIHSTITAYDEDNFHKVWSEGVNTVIVHGDGYRNIVNVPDEYSTIQSALNAAGENNIILVQPGTYTENILWPNVPNIHLISELGPEQTIIDGNLSGTVIDFGDGQNWGLIHLEGFTIKNGAANDGAGLRISFPSSADHSLTMNKMIIENNYGQSGGAMWVSPSYGSIKLLSSIIRNNTGTAIWGVVLNAATFEIVNTLIYDNEGGAYGYGNFNAGNGLKVINCTIVNNNGSSPNGGAFALSSGNLEVVNSIILNNQPTDITTVGAFGNIIVNNSIITNDENSVTIFYPSEAIQFNWSDNLYGINPDFTDESNEDFHLLDYSLAIGAGTTLGAPDVDIEGNLRPIPTGSNPDIGAYENALGTPAYLPQLINVPYDYSTIQSALSAANETDTVLVQPGTYTENIIWPETNGIKLISAGDSSNTIIDGGGLSSVIYMNPQTVTIDTTTLIQGFKITNGGNVSNGAGMYLANSNPKIISLICSDNMASGSQGKGAGMYLNNSNPAISNSIIKNNTITNGGEEGGGMWLGESSPIIDNVIISNNNSFVGAGLYINNDSNPIMNDIIISNNIDQGIHITNSTLVLSNSLIENNSAYEGGGIFCEYSTLDLNYVIVKNNTAVNGGGIRIAYSEANILNTNIIGNYGSSTGGGLRLENGISINFDNVNIIYNDGYGIWTDGNASISNVNIIGNTLGIFSNNVSTISNSNILNNETGLFNNNNDNIVSATGNYWGHSSGPFHPTQNSGGQGDSVSTFVDVDPWLTTPNTDAPPIPAQNTIITSSGNDFISLSWDASLIGDLAGYKLYYDSDSSEYPYTNSVDVGTDTSYTLSSLSLGTTYYLAVTTYDTDGNESWYSNELTGVTRVIQAQNLDIGDNEDLQHMISHTPSITFNYYDSMNETQTNYQVQVSSDSTFSSADMWDSGEVTSSDTAVTYAGTTLEDGTTYYLRVKVGAGSFYSDWADITFRMNTEPTTPVLLSPLNDEVSGTPVVLNVFNASDAEGDTVTYSFNVYDDANLTTKLDSVTALTEGIDTTSWQIIASLPDNGQYFWSVSANDGYEESAVSDLGSFLLNTDNNPPDAFTLSIPSANMEVQSLSPVFSWHPASDPDPIDTVHYTLILDTPDPGVLVFEVGTDTSFQVPDTLMDNIRYFWQVIAEDLLGFQTINEGGYQTFYTNVSNDPPTTAVLVAPLNGSIQTDLTPNFYWTEADDPDPMDHVSYTLSWWGTGDMGIQSIDTDSNSVTPETIFMDNSMWEWMVTANDMYGAESSSDSSYFYTDAFPEPPANFATVTPENNAEGIATEVEFVWNETDDPDPVEEIHYQLVYATDWADSSTYVFSELIQDTSLTVTLANNSQYYWIVVAMDTDGFMVGSNDNTSNTMVVGTLSIDGADIPEVFALHQNYPNPFNPTTQIRYDLPEDALVNITIYDIMGRNIKSLVNSNQLAGYRSIQWNATNNLGEPVSAGMYIYMIQAGEFRESKKMVLLK